MRSYEFINLVSSRAVQLDEETRRYNVKSLLTNYKHCIWLAVLKYIKSGIKKGREKQKKNTGQAAIKLTDLAVITVMDSE